MVQRIWRTTFQSQPSAITCALPPLRGARSSVTAKVIISRIEMTLGPHGRSNRHCASVRGVDETPSLAAWPLLRPSRHMNKTSKKARRRRILKNGPYLVTGSISALQTDHWHGCGGWF